MCEGVSRAFSRGFFPGHFLGGFPLLVNVVNIVLMVFFHLL